jgi:mannose-6-phosphate isomerase-like protein (cupin superfamily)
MTEIVPAGEGDCYETRSDARCIKLEGADTAGEYTLIEHTIKPGFDAPLQLHRRHSATFYVLEGAITFTIGTRRVEATPGTTIHLPVNTPHAARSDRPGRMLVLFSPAGLEEGLRALGALDARQAQDPATRRAIMDRFDIVDLDEPPFPALLGYYDALLEGDVDLLRELFSGEPHVDGPLEGQVKGEEALGAYVSAQRAWLSARAAHPEFLDVTLTPERIVLEWVLEMRQDDEAFDLPVAMAADRDGAAISALRVYHSTWPLTGHHAVRAPLLDPPAAKPDEPAVVQAYTAGLREGNAEFVVSLFAEDGYAREPSGSRFRYAGADGLVQFYGPALSGGGIMVHHRTATADGHACAVEYVCDAWAGVPLPPQAGLAVYELAGPGKIRAARIYDDVAPPFE